jgi:hypothetical protein
VTPSEVDRSFTSFQCLSLPKIRFCNNGDEVRQGQRAHGQKAVEIHIFPEALRGTGEGHRPWDLMPNSTMTNATVAQMVKGVQGDEITLKYKDGEKKIVVAPNTTIVTYHAADVRLDSPPAARNGTSGLQFAGPS